MKYIEETGPQYQVQIRTCQLYPSLTTHQPQRKGDPPCTHIMSYHFLAKTKVHAFRQSKIMKDIDPRRLDDGEVKPIDDYIDHRNGLMELHGNMSLFGYDKRDCIF